MTTQAKHDEPDAHEFDEKCPDCGHIACRCTDPDDNEPILDSLVAALASLALEAEHFRANRIGEQFLVSAINNANEVLAKEASKSSP